jgi:hypothetical protein
MAARKKKIGARKKTTRSRSKGAFDIQLPKTLKGFTTDVGKQLGKLEKEIEKTAASARKQATRLLRDASRTLGRYEAKGEKAWKSLTRTAGRDAEDVLSQLEGFLSGGKKKTKKKAKKKVARKKAKKKATKKAR